MGDRWTQLEALYHDAAALPAAERARFLDDACAANVALRADVEALLAHADTSFLDQPALLERETSDLVMGNLRLAPGTRIGPYEVIGPLGAGGMGEVYRARDSNLGRDVAIKILPRAFTTNSERLARFEREARILAALNHPHIAAIYGLEEGAGVRALVLELVEGQTIADRLQRGPIPFPEALTIARQVADALDAGHEKGIIHRDLKPANIMITPDGTVKVLDFGLAKAAASHASTPDLTQSPTVTVGGTRDGLLLGTAAYMSPEQAAGKAVDRRSDLWAFGVVLLEMVTGRPVFTGETVSHVLASVLKDGPDWATLPSDTPEAIRRLVRRCLEKDRKKRLADAGDARLEIDDALSGHAATIPGLAPAPARRLAPAIAALASGALIAALVTWALTRPAHQPLIRFAIVPPVAHALTIFRYDRDVAVSPDGRHIVYRAGGSFLGGPLMVRSIDSLEAQPLLGVTAARWPFFSLDSRWIGFFDGTDGLKKVSISGGSALTLCRYRGAPRGASWVDNDTIVFATNNVQGLQRVSTGGGEPTVMTTPDAAKNEGHHWFPSVLPGGRGVLFTITTGDEPENTQVAVLDLKTGERRTLIRGGSQAEYVETGHLIYAGGETLRAVRFDLATLKVLSDPVPVVEHVMVASTGAANYGVSRTGTLVYVPGGTGQITPRSLVWVDRKGHETAINAPLRAYAAPRLSPDGMQVAVDIHDQDNDIWVWDFARQNLRRLTFGPSLDQAQVWTPDSQRIIFESQRGGSVPNLYAQAADGTGAVDRLTTSDNSQYPNSISPDGRHVIGFEASPKTGNDIVLFPLASATGRPDTGQSRVVLLIQTPFDESHAEVSPDGRYLAYQSNESGHFEVYVRPFPNTNDGRLLVSTDGGTRPAWARNGRELFYLDGTNKLTVAAVRRSTTTFSVGKPARVFDTQYAAPSPFRNYDISPDGQRFLMIKESATGDPNTTPASLVVVLSWFDELKARVPTK